MTDFFRFEIEHIFNQALWEETSGSIGAFLDANGYTRNMGGNQILLYSDPLLIEQLENLPDNHPMRRALLNGNGGITRHEGRASGGSQLGQLELR